MWMCMCYGHTKIALHTMHKHTYRLIIANVLGNWNADALKLGEKICLGDALHPRYHDNRKNLPCSVCIGGYNKDIARGVFKGIIVSSKHCQPRRDMSHPLKYSSVCQLEMVEMVPFVLLLNK